MSKHTQGPWAAIESQPREVRLKRQHWEIGSTSTRRGVAYVFGADDANAKLIAAAPDLLEALQGLLSECNRHGCFENVSFEFPTVKPFFDAARAAIAKATGEA